MPGSGADEGTAVLLEVWSPTGSKLLPAHPSLVAPEGRLFDPDRDEPCSTWSRAMNGSLARRSDHGSFHDAFGRFAANAHRYPESDRRDGGVRISADWSGALWRSERWEDASHAVLWSRTRGRVIGVVDAAQGREPVRRAAERLAPDWGEISAIPCTITPGDEGTAQQGNPE